MTQKTQGILITITLVVTVLSLGVAIYEMIPKKPTLKKITTDREMDAPEIEVDDVNIVES